MAARDYDLLHFLKHAYCKYAFTALISVQEHTVDLLCHSKSTVSHVQDSLLHVQSKQSTENNHFSVDFDLIF